MSTDAPQSPDSHAHLTEETRVMADGVSTVASEWGFSARETVVEETDRRPLIFMIGAGILLFLVAIFILFKFLIAPGRNMAEGPTAPAPISSTSTSAEATEAPAAEQSSAEPTESEHPAQGIFDDSRAAVLGITDTTTCNDANRDGQVFVEFVNAAIDTDSWNEENQTLVTDKLAELDEHCTNLGHKQNSTQLLNLFLSGAAPTELEQITADGAWITNAMTIPEGSIEVSNGQSFTSAVRNIHCVFGENAVECTIDSFAANTVEQCPGTGPATFTIDANGSTSVSCDSRVSAQAEAQYDVPYTNGIFACEIGESSGFNCWHETTGHGFQLRRQSQDVY